MDFQMSEKIDQKNACSENIDKLMRKRELTWKKLDRLHQSQKISFINFQKGVELNKNFLPKIQ